GALTAAVACLVSARTTTIGEAAAVGVGGARGGSARTTTGDAGGVRHALGSSSRAESARCAVTDLAVLRAAHADALEVRRLGAGRPPTEPAEDLAHGKEVGRGLGLGA